MAEDPNPYIALLNEIGNPISPLKLQRMIRRELVTEKKTIPELEGQIKQLAPSQPKLSEEAQHAWNKRFSDLIRKAANRTIEYAEADRWEALRAATGYAITIVDLQAKFRKLWDPECDTWLDLDIQARGRLFEDIFKETSQTKNVLPSDPQELAVFENTLRLRINEAGKKSWSLMKRSRAKKRRMEGEGGGGRVGNQTGSHGALDGETGEKG